MDDNESQYGAFLTRNAHLANDALVVVFKDGEPHPTTMGDLRVALGAGR